MSAQAAKARPQTGGELARWPSRSESVVRGFPKTRPKQRGAALIELAVSLPFVVLLFIGLLDLTIFFYQRTQVQLTLHTAARSIMKNRAAYSDSANLDRLSNELFKNDVAFRLRHEDGLLRVDAVRPITPMLRPLAAAGYPSQIAARAFIRLK